MAASGEQQQPNCACLCVASHKQPTQHLSAAICDLHAFGETLCSLAYEKHSLKLYYVSLPDTHNFNSDTCRSLRVKADLMLSIFNTGVHAVFLHMH